MLDELDRRRLLDEILTDLAANAVELSNAALELAERCAQQADALVAVADWNTDTDKEEP